MILFHFEPNQNPRPIMLPSINIWTSKPLSITYSLKVFCTVGVSYRIQRSTRATWPRRSHVSKNVSTANSIPCPPPISVRTCFCPFDYFCAYSVFLQVEFLYLFCLYTSSVFAPVFFFVPSSLLRRICVYSKCPTGYCLFTNIFQNVLFFSL